MTSGSLMTITQIAKWAKVSKSTVSRVLNNSAAVRPEVAEKVRAAMKAHNYAPPAVKRGPKPKLKGLLQSNTTIGVLLYGRTRELLQFPAMVKMMSGIVETLNAVDLSPSIIEMPDPLFIPKAISAGNLGGLIILGSQNSKESANRLHPLPCVFVGGMESDFPIADHVLPNSRLIVSLAADYLIRCGCKHPALINHDFLHPALAQRALLFSDYLTRHGVEPLQFVPHKSKSKGDEGSMWSPARLRAGFEKLIDEMLAAPVRPDGLFIPTDQQAAMVWTILKERGIKPGKDIITISCNNDEAWLATMHPRPATIDVRSEEIGRESALRMLAHIRNPQDSPVVSLVTPRLIPGEEECLRGK